MIDINSVPWGVVWLDGRPVGDTPILHLALPPGVHRVAVRHEGFEPFTRVLVLSPGERVRLIDITLQRVTE